MQCQRIGTAAYPVTEVLDEGPIIEQGMERISHRDALDVLVAIGCDIEEAVRSRAERWHIENRILLYKNMTVIFER
jgi:formyltetrahydrofolate deformylase